MDPNDWTAWVKVKLETSVPVIGFFAVKIKRKRPINPIFTGIPIRAIKVANQ